MLIVDLMLDKEALSLARVHLSDDPDFRGRLGLAPKVDFLAHFGKLFWDPRSLYLRSCRGGGLESTLPVPLFFVAHFKSAIHKVFNGCRALSIFSTMKLFSQSPYLFLFLLGTPLLHDNLQFCHCNYPQGLI